MKITNLNQLPSQTVSHNPEIKKKVMLTSGDLPHLTNFSQAVFAPGQIASNHCHQDMSEVFFVQSGEGIICINGQNFTLNQGACIAVEVGEYHEITNTGNVDLVLTYFGIKQ
jgi:quercetin dioxygenase-like cupin family protein